MAFPDNINSRSQSPYFFNTGSNDIEIESVSDEPCPEGQGLIGFDRVSNSAQPFGCEQPGPEGPGFSRPDETSAEEQNELLTRQLNLAKGIIQIKKQQCALLERKLHSSLDEGKKRYKECQDLITKLSAFGAHSSPPVFEEPPVFWDPPCYQSGETLEPPELEAASKELERTDLQYYRLTTFLLLSDAGKKRLLETKILFEEQLAAHRRMRGETEMEESTDSPDSPVEKRPASPSSPSESSHPPKKPRLTLGYSPIVIEEIVPDATPQTVALSLSK